MRNSDDFPASSPQHGVTCRVLLWGGVVVVMWTVEFDVHSSFWMSEVEIVVPLAFDLKSILSYVPCWTQDCCECVSDSTTTKVPMSLSATS